MSKVTLTNMCMVYDNENNKVLVQDRIKSWKGRSIDQEATLRKIM